SSEPSDGNARNESPPIRKPFYQDCDRNDVTKTKTDSADEAVTEIEPPQVMREAGEKNSQSIERPARQCNDARPFSIQPQATKERGNAQDKNADRERQHNLRNPPPEL